jgi:AraC family transcriptional regulator of adaptative response/methylated-DNA-[protein]-cysteine methyltransferase
MMNEDQMYAALVNKDKAYDGSFYVGVKTTGIFCRTVCTARKPKRENVSFYSTVNEAMAAGYRPCKICRPLEGIGAIPIDIKGLIEEVEREPQRKIKEYELKQRGYDPATLRRWFQKHYGMSFSAFCRMNRINHAFGRLKEGEDVLQTALESGYESVSGFSDAYGKVMGTAPGRKHQPEPLLYKHFDTPLGPMMAIANGEGLVLLEFGDRRMLESELSSLIKHFKCPLLPGTNSYIEKTIEEVDLYMKGELKVFSVPLVWVGTAFQKRVWQSLMEIPYGEVRSYQEQAKAMGQPSAVRAVGTANGMNKLAIIIPCHRVIGSDGNLTGYGGGVWRKEWLLKLEKASGNDDI